jgi:hypothetical protein
MFKIERKFGRKKSVQFRWLFEVESFHFERVDCIPINKLEDHFKKIFNEKESNFNQFQLNVKDDVEKYENNINLSQKIDIEFNEIDIDYAIKESKNSKAIGLDDIRRHSLI